MRFSSLSKNRRFAEKKKKNKKKQQKKQGIQL